MDLYCHLISDSKLTGNMGIFPFATEGFLPGLLQTCHFSAYISVFWKLLSSFQNRGEKTNLLIVQRLVIDMAVKGQTCEVIILTLRSFQNGILERYFIYRFNSQEKIFLFYTRFILNNHFSSTLPLACFCILLCSL